MKKELKQKWIKALRSGKYRQGEGILEGNRKYCCLGVLCRAAGKRIPREHGIARLLLPVDLLKEFGISDARQNRYATYNDEGATFEQIADLIEKDKRL